MKHVRTSPKDEFAGFVVDQMAAFAPVEARRMFGGHGIFRDGLMFALIVDGRLHFKTDAASAQRYAALGLQPFRYTSRGRTVALGYHEAPLEVFDHPAQMAEWASLAFDVALRAAAAKRQ